MTAPRTRFVIFSMARSGSSYLTTSLRSHPEVLCHGEALSPRHVPRQLWGSARETLTAEMCETDPADFAYRLLDIADGRPVTGFKVFATQSPAAHGALLEDPGIAKIVLRRENALAAWSSLLIARETGRWDAQRAGIGEGATTRFGREEFDRYRRRAEAYFERLDARIRGPRLDLAYTADIMTGNMPRVLDFLGADPGVGTYTVKSKILGRDVVGRFENADEVRAYLEEIGRPDWAEE